MSCTVLPEFIAAPMRDDIYIGIKIRCPTYK